MVRLLLTFGLTGAATALLMPDFVEQPVCLAKAAIDAAATPAICPSGEIGHTAKAAARRAEALTGLTA